MLFDRPYSVHDFLFVFHCNYICILHLFEILSLISENLKTSRDYAYAYARDSL